MIVFRNEKQRETDYEKTLKGYRTRRSNIANCRILLMFDMVAYAQIFMKCFARIIKLVRSFIFGTQQKRKENRFSFAMG